LAALFDGPHRQSGVAGRHLGPALAALLLASVACGGSEPRATGPVSCNDVESSYRRIWQQDVRRAPEQSIELEMNWVHLREKLARECAGWSDSTRACVVRAKNRFDLARCEP
jgi:hypothetical protein